MTPKIRWDGSFKKPWLNSLAHRRQQNVVIQTADSSVEYELWNLHGSN